MCKKKIILKKPKCKRYFLIIELSSFLLFHKYFRNLYYFPLIVIINAFFLFWNFPKLVVSSTSKPIYFEDLFIDNKKSFIPNSLPVIIQNKIINIYNWILIITSSLLLGILSYYWLSKYSEKDSILVIIGITGGVIKIYQIINKIIATISLFIIRKKINKYIKIYKKDLKEKIELTSILNEQFKEICKNCKTSYDILNKIKSKKSKIVKRYNNKKFNNKRFNYINIKA
mgnify:CR=1 FL=1|tara:strand:- start:1004 stop:1687 length:684 start_codon:yes stop_codon:yes gene_type:complete